MVTLATYFFLSTCLQLPLTEHSEIISTFVQWGPCRKLNVQCNEPKGTAEATFVPALTTLHLCVRIMWKMQTEEAARQRDDLCLVYNGKKCRYGNLVHQDSLCWGSSQQKFFQHKGNVIDKLDIRSVDMTWAKQSKTELLIVEKTKHGLIAKMSKKKHKRRRRNKNPV